MVSLSVIINVLLYLLPKHNKLIIRERNLVLLKLPTALYHTIHKNWLNSIQPLISNRMGFVSSYTALISIADKLEYEALNSFVTDTLSW